PPGLTRKWFGFQGWPEFDRPLWNAIRDAARRGVSKELPAPISGSDRYKGAIELARANARSAGVGHLVRLEGLDVADTRPPRSGPGVVIVNPPYGERIGEEKELVPLYAKLGEVIATHWARWRLFVLTANDQLARKVGLPVRCRVPFFNGKLRCHLWEFGTDADASAK